MAVDALSLFFCALGLMSKPMLVTLPFVLLLLDIWPLRRFGWMQQNKGPSQARSEAQPARPGIRPLLLEKAPFFFLAALSSMVTYLVQERGHSVTVVLPLWPRLANAIASYLKYLGKTVWPANLAIFYPHPATRYPHSTQWPAWEIVLAGLFLLGVTVAAVRDLKRRPWFAVGWFWFLGTLVPVIGIVQVGGQAMADRYTYIPLIGVFVCVAWGASDFWKGGRVAQMTLTGAAVPCGDSQCRGDPAPMVLAG